MLSLAAMRSDYVRRLERAMEEVVRVLASWPEVERISVFGSFARGRRDLGTDLDILVLLRTEEPFLERLRRVYGSVALGVDADFFCYTPEEWERMKDGPFWRYALADEKVFYEKTTA